MGCGRPPCSRCGELARAIEPTPATWAAVATFALAALTACEKPAPIVTLEADFQNDDIWEAIGGDGDDFIDFDILGAGRQGGVTPYETLQSVIDSYWEYYPLSHFMHQRIGFVFGSRDEVERIERYHAEPAPRAWEAPLFAERSLFRAEHATVF